jgi:hypothetical protein
LRIGLLTSDTVRKYPLRSANLAVFLKAYALHAKISFTLDNQNFNLFDEYRLYLTEAGLAWLMHEFKKYTLIFLRTTFQFIFSNLKDMKDLDNYNGLNNFKGITGINFKSGGRNKALLVQRKASVIKSFEFENLIEARKEILSMTRFYPMEQFTLYRTGVSGKGVYYKHKVPLILEPNRRGVSINLPHLKGKI